MELKSIIHAEQLAQNENSKNQSLIQRKREKIMIFFLQ